jgi:hypothetical protein
VGHVEGHDVRAPNGPDCRDAEDVDDTLNAHSDHEGAYSEYEGAHSDHEGAYREYEGAS